MGRRGFVKYLTTLGMGTGAIQYISQDAFAAKAADPKDEMVIPTKRKIKNPEKLRDGLPKNPPLEMETIYERVPFDEWARTETAHAAAVNISKKLKSEFSGNVGNVLVSTDHRRSGAQKEIIVRTKSNKLVESIQAVLPNTASGTIGTGSDTTTQTGIPVRVEQQSITLDEFEYDYSPDPGGAHGESVYNNNADDITFFQLFYNGSAGEYQMATAGHAFEENGDTVDSFAQPDDSPYPDNRLGYSWDYRYDPVYDSNGDLIDVNFDAGLISPDSDSDVTTKIAGSNGNYKGDIAGYYTYSKIKNEEGNTSWKVKLQGSSGGVYEGYINTTDPVDTFYGCSFDAIGGDSGGPYFRRDSADQINTIGVHSYSGGNSHGMHLSRILDKWDLDFA